MTLYPVRNVRVVKFVELTGWTEDAIQKKIKSGKWIEGREYHRRDGVLLIDLEAYDKWAENPPAAARSLLATASS